MEPISYITAIAGLASAANQVWSVLDTFNSTDRDLLDLQHEIDFLTNEFNSLSNLSRRWTQANSFNRVAHLGGRDFGAALARFQDGLRRVEGIMAHVKKSQGNLGKLMRGCKKVVKDKELTKLRGHIASIRAHLQTMLHVRDSYLIELIATEILASHSIHRAGSVVSEISSSDKMSVDGLPPVSPITSSAPGQNSIMSPPPSPTDFERRMSDCGSGTSTSSSPVNYEERRQFRPTPRPRPSLRRSGPAPPPSPPPSPPPNPPPILKYKALEVVDLKKLLPRGFGRKISLNGISPTGCTFALLSKTQFAVLTKSALICTGELNQGKTVALNDKYLFIGADNRILVFAIRGDYSGKLVHVRDIGADMMIDKLIVSPDGNTLLVLAKKTIAIQFAETYSANLELPQFREDFVPTCASIIWTNCKRVHSSASFSADGNKIVIYTSHCRQGHSEIRFLRKSNQQWLRWRTPLVVKILSDDPVKQLGEKGVTGAAILHNKHVVWAVDSAREHPHSWVDFDNPAAPANTTPFAREGTRIIDMNTSNMLSAIVQMDRKGALYFKQYMDVCRFPTVDEPHVPLDRPKGVKVPPPGPRTMSFTQDGGEFLILTGNCELEVHHFKKSETYGQI